MYEYGRPGVKNASRLHEKSLELAPLAEPRGQGHFYAFYVTRRVFHAHVFRRRLFFSASCGLARTRALPFFPFFNEIPRQETFHRTERQRMEFYYQRAASEPISVSMAFAMPARVLPICLFVAEGSSYRSNGSDREVKGGARAAKGLQSCRIIRQGNTGACFAQTSVAPRVASTRDATSLSHERSSDATMRLISLFLVIDRLPRYPPPRGGIARARAARAASCRLVVVARSLVLFPRPSWPTFTRLPSPLCSLHTSRGCNLRLTERKPKGSDHVVTRSVRIGSLNEETRRCERLSPSSLSSLDSFVRFHLVDPIARRSSLATATRKSNPGLRREGTTRGVGSRRDRDASRSI